MFVIIVNQILKMLLLLLLGCLCFRMRLIDENGSKVLANLLLMVVNPMLAIVSLQTEYSAHLAQGLLVAYLLAFLTHLVAAILSTVLIRTTGNPDCGIDRFASMYSNCGFIGIPLVQSILGNEGVLYLDRLHDCLQFLFVDARHHDHDWNFLFKGAEKGPALPHDLCQHPRRGVLFRQDPHPVSAARLYELCRRYEHAARHAHSRYFCRTD